MKHGRKTLSVLLTLAMLLTLASALGGTARADAPTTEWSAVEYRDISWGSDYDSASTFTVNDEEDFAQFAYLVNAGTDHKTFEGKTVKLAADLDLSAHKWTPIGNDSDLTFKGVFNGGGHTVSGMYINCSPEHTFYAGLFGFLNNGTVQNLNVSGSVSVKVAEEQNAYVGGVVGENSGASQARSTVENCYYNGSITVEGSPNTTIYAGGIVGWNYSYSIVTSCCHSGSITAKSPSTTYVGGIVGYNKSNSTVTNCCHNGSVSVKDSNSNAYAGGVVACNESSTVSNCYGCGNIKAAAESGNACAIAGGVVGTNNKESEGSSSSTVTNCYHNGDVTANTEGTEGGNTAAGGVVAFNANSVVTNCYHSGGAVKASTTGTSPNFAAGGVVGIKLAGSTCNQCYFLSGTAGNDIGLNGVGNDSTDVGAAPLTAAQFNARDSFTGWDFSTVWIMGADAPLLRALAVSVAFDANGGTGTMAAQYVPKGAATPLIANAFTREDYHFAGWSTTAGGAVKYADKASVTLAADTTLYAVWQVSAAQEPSEPFSQEFTSPLTFDGGKVVVSPTKAGIRDTVTLTVIPDAGNELKDLTVTHKGVGAVKTVDHGSGVFTFTMPGGNVAFDAVFGTPEAETPPQTPQPAPQTPPVKPNAVLSPQKITVNGVEVTVEAYNIGGTNFFKLRDLAALLKGTPAQFNVDYDANRNAVVMTKGAAYDGAVAAEFADNSASAVASPQTVELDGQAVGLTAYNIGGSNFFGLRELAAYLGYTVDYDAAANTAIIVSR